MTWIKAYKGFDKDMKCRGFQFVEGQEYEEQEAKLCEKGFHACEAPIDCLRYYNPAHSVYHEVKLEATDEKENDSKRVGKRIKIGAKIGIANMVKAQFDYIKEHCTNENNAEPGKAASAGAYGAASAGYRGAASAGESGAACSRGSASVENDGIACVRGNGVKVRGGMGAVLVIVNEHEYDCEITEWKAAVVDGITIKPNTWYKLQDGEFVEDNDND